MDELLVLNIKDLDIRTQRRINHQFVILSEDRVSDRPVNIQTCDSLIQFDSIVIKVVKYRSASLTAVIKEHTAKASKYL